MKRGLSITLVLVFILSLLPISAFAAATTDYATQVAVSKDSTKFSGRDTVLVEYQVKTLHSKTLATTQSVALAFDATLFDYLKYDYSAIKDSSTLTESLEKTGSADYSTVPQNWIKSLFWAKIGDVCYAMPQPNLTTDYDPFSSAEAFSTIASFRLALKAGKTVNDIAYNSIRFINLDEMQTLNQTSIASVHDGTTQYKYGERVGTSFTGNDTLAAPGFTFTGFTPTVPAYTGTQASKPTVASKHGGSVTLTANAQIDGEDVEYAYASTSTAPSSGWVTTTAFTGLSAGDYYFFARVAAKDTDHLAGTAAVSDKVTVFAAPSVSYATNTLQSMVIGTAITAMTPTVTGGSGVASYAMTGDLPAGLAFSTSTGVISGTPTTYAASGGSFKVTVTDSEGTVSAEATVSYGAVARKSSTLEIATPTDITYGGTPTHAEPTTNTSGGTVTYTYSTSETGTYSAWNTANPVGTYYAKGSTPVTGDFAAAESLPVSFHVTQAAISGTVAISGTEKFGQVLTATPGTIPGTNAYKWYRGSSEISGATASTYTLTAADIGKTITVKVTDSAGNYSGSVDSTATGSIAKADAPTGVTGTVDLYYASSSTGSYSVNSLTGLPTTGFTGAKFSDASITADTDSVLTSVTASNAAAFSYTPTGSAVAGKSATVSATVTSDTYADFTATITFNTVDISIPWPTAGSGITVKAAPAYGDTNGSIISGFTTGTVTATAAGNNITGKFSVKDASAHPAAGTTTATLVFTCDGSQSISGSFEHVYTITAVQKAPLTVTAKANAITYGDAPAANGVTYSGFVGGEDSSNLTGTLAYDFTYAQFGDVGSSYTITPKGYTNNNYAYTYTAGTLTVNKKTLTVGAGDYALTKVYDGTTAAGTAGGALALTGLVNSDAVSVTVGTIGSYADKSVGSAKTVSLTGLTLTGAKSGNYTLGANTSFSFTAAEITARPITVTVTPASREYGQANPSFAATVKSGSSLGTGDAVVDLGLGLSSTAAADSAPGSYDVTGDGTYNSNYTVTVEGTGALTVTKATSTLTLTAATVTYTAQTAAAPQCTKFPADATVTFKYSTTANGVYTDGLPKNAGSYYVKGNIAATANYTAVESAAVAFTINRASVAVTWTHTNDLAYTGSAQKPTAVATGLGSDGALALTVSGEKTAVGTGYTATAAFTDEQGNYTLTNTTTQFAIAKAQLTVTEATVSKVYDGTAAIANGNVSGVKIGGAGASFVQGTDYTVTGSYSDNANAATSKHYTLKLTLLGAAADSYTVADYSGTNGVVTAKPVTISGAVVDDKVYDGTTAANCTAVSFTGMVTGQTPYVGSDYTITGAEFGDADAGTDKAVTVTVVWKNTNYSLATSTFAGAADISAATVSGVPIISIKTDGGTIGTVDAGDVLTVSVANMTPSAAGEYSFQWKRGTENIGTNSADYTVVSGDANATITCVATYTADGNYAGFAASSGLTVGKGVLTGTLALNKTGAQTVGTAVTATLTGGPAAENYEIVWLRDGVKIDGAANTYTIAKADRGHTVTAKAIAKGETYYGELTTADTVTVAAAVPGAPTVTAAAGAKRAVLTWAPAEDNGGKPVTGYKVYNGEELITTLPNTSTTYTVTGLSDSTAYSFKVSALNSIGEGAKGSASEITTADVPGEVTGLTATAGYQSVSLNWTAPDANRSPITGYKIYMKTTGDFDAGTLIGNVSSYSVKGLTTGTQYSFKVSAINEVGEGDASGTVVSTPTEAMGGGGVVTTPTPSEKIELTKPGLSDTQVKDAVKAAQTGNKPAVVVEAPTLTNTTIPASGLAATAEAGLGMDISQKNGGISMSKDVMTNLAKQADGGKTLDVSIKPVESLPQSDPAAAELPAGTQVFDINVKLGDTSVHELGGKATVTLKVGSEMNGKNVAILHFENGKWNVVAQGIVKDGKFSVEVDSLSYFGVAMNYNPFSDVGTNDWYYNSVMFAYGKGIIKGVSTTSFGPNQTTTRGMLVTMLYRLEGSPSTVNFGFTDIASDASYTAAVNWAAANKIVSGYGDGKFGPNDVITREQMVTILYNYARFKGVSSIDLTVQLTYPDKSQISGWAVDAAKFCQSKALITGRDGGYFAPQGTATRAEVATILMRFIGA